MMKVWGWSLPRSQTEWFPAAAGLAESERFGRTNFLPRLHGVSATSLLLVSAIRISLCFLSLGTLEM